MIAPYFPAIFVPIIGIFLPGLAMAALFVYIEKESKKKGIRLQFLLVPSDVQ